MPTQRDYQRWARKGTTKQRGLSGHHQSHGKQLKANLRDGTPCWRCGFPMYRWQKLDRDHVTPRALGGTDGPAVLAHARCNRSAGARLGNAMRGQAKAASRGRQLRPSLPVPLRTSRQW